jgi:putative ABC transport system substrate-binding protein
MQQTHRVGVLVGLALSEDTPIAQAFIKPFRESMRSAGWIEGGNIQIYYASAVLSPTYPKRKRPQPSW